MPILNKTDYPYLYPDRIELRSNSYAFEIRKWDDAKYFYVEFLLGAAFRTHHISSYIPLFYQSLIRNNEKTFLVLNNCHEAFHGVVEDIYKHLVIENSIPAEKIILISESADVHEVVKEYAEKNNLTPIHVEWARMFQATVKIQRSQQLEDPAYHNFETLALKEYPKRYLNFNRRWRMHRPTLVALLAAYNLLDNGFVSLGKADCGTEWSHVYHWIHQRLNSDPELFEILGKCENKILNLPPLYLDNEDLMTNKANLETSTDFYYANSLFSVVSETNFFPEFETGRFLSEKAWKPVAYKHPFIIVSVPRTLKLMRSLGFKTFHPFIDESYDGEIDPVIRIKMIVKEIKRISEFDQDQIKEFIDGVKPRVEHNFNMLMNSNNFLQKML